MTGASSDALIAFFNAFGFNARTLFALLAVGVLTVAVIEQEVLRAVNPALRKRNGRVLAVVIFPLALLTFVVIVARFVRLGG